MGGEGGALRVSVWPSEVVLLCAWFVVRGVLGLGLCSCLLFPVPLMQPHPGPHPPPSVLRPLDHLSHAPKTWRWRSG